MSFTKSIITYLACLLGLNIVFTQSDFESLGETAFALNTNISSDYKINFALRSRYYLYQDEAFNFENRQIDLVHFSTFNFDYNRSVSFGLQYRFRESIDGGSDELRLTQQFNYTKKREGLRFGHRTRIEQRILNHFTIFRTRYRFALDFPLKGQKLDINEAYFIGSVEALLSISKSISPEVDQRTTVQIGWLLRHQLRLQFGLEYRFEAFNINTEERLFVLTSAILKI